MSTPEPSIPIRHKNPKLLLLKNADTHMETTNAIGRRKAAVARVYLHRGNGKFTINDRKMDDYLPMSTLRSFVEEPFKILEIDQTYDVTVNVAGGGIKGQTEA